MDPIAVKGAGLVAKATVKALLSRLPTDADRVRATWEAMKEEILVETAAALDRLVAKHGALVGEVARKLDERAVTVLCVQLHEQAMKSAMRERLRLMAAAIAGVFTPEVDLEMKSRATRALALLEPSDVLILRGIAATGKFHAHGRRAEWARDRLAPLVAAGCIAIEEGRFFVVAGMDEGFPARMREIGADVLRLVETWQEAPAATWRAMDRDTDG